jgi:GNAT superfamily N-acetyltransferase
MDIALRPGRAEDCPGLTDLCLRSKAHWGYDADFMALCVPALTVTEANLGPRRLVLAEAAGAMLGMAELTVDGGVAELEKIFVAPEALGQGVGRALMDWAMARAREQGARRLEVLADPHALAFYERMGARQLGWAPSDAIPGRRLPRMAIAL